MTSATLIAPKATVNFIHDLAIFAPSMDAHTLKNVAETVFVAEGSLPVMTARPSLALAKKHVMTVVEHLLSDFVYLGGLELHLQSVITRAGYLLQAFAREDLASERSGRLNILSGEEWRRVHTAIVRGCMGYVPMIRRNGTMRPAGWAVDLLEMTARLAEVSWGVNERTIAAAAHRGPSENEKKIASTYTKGMIAAKDAMLASAAPEARQLATAWLKDKAQFLRPTPRPAGCLDLDGKSWIRLPPKYRTVEESEAAAAEAAIRERNAAGATVIHGGWTMPVARVSREIVDCLRDNRKRGHDAVRAAMAC
jgi:hypothetical protein